MLVTPKPIPDVPRPFASTAACEALTQIDDLPSWHFAQKQTYSLPNLGLKGWFKKTTDERMGGEMLVMGSSYEIPAPSIHSCKKSDGSCPKTKQMSWRKKARENNLPPENTQNLLTSINVIK